MVATAPADVLVHEAERETLTFRVLAVAGFASLAGGAIHATAAGSHSEHKQAVVAFVAVALLQIGWGALALVRATVPVALLGIAVNGGAVGGWLLAKTNGISFVDGLEEKESVQFADGAAAACAAVAVVIALAAIVIPKRRFAFAPFATRTLTGLAAVAALVVAVPGMVQAGNHAHAGGHSHEAGGETAAAHSHDDAAANTGTEASGAAADHAHSEGQPFDPTLPIDLGGTPGVTPQQQAEAENLLALNLARLPQWADTNVAYAAGYRSIGDSLTGDEHWIKWSLIDDDKVLDPDYPEALVYKVEEGGGRTLEAAMYMLPEGETLETVPPIGGGLIQWHIHDNLCFTPIDEDGSAKVAGVVGADVDCRPPLVKFTPVPMIHVWIASNPCGPFASLEGVGAGQIAEGEERLCDHAHGSDF
jgi:hypothetical protein